MMSFTYNISYGIAFGIISWLLIRLVLNLISLAGKKKEGATVEAAKPDDKINVVTVVIAILFLLMFFLTH